MWYLCWKSGLERQYLSGISFSLVYISNLFLKKNHSTLIVFIINHKPELCVNEYVSECVQVCVCALVCISVYVSNFIEQPLLF